jgi:hypothetical protein
MQKEGEIREMVYREVKKVAFRYWKSICQSHKFTTFALPSVPLSVPMVIIIIEVDSLLKCSQSSQGNVQETR